MACCFLTYNFPLSCFFLLLVLFSIHFYPVRQAPFLLEQPLLRPGLDVNVFSAPLITPLTQDIFLAPS